MRGITHNTNMRPRIVLDTSVLISALRSRQGASFRLLSLIDENKFEFVLSVPLVIEYEAVAKRLAGEFGLSAVDIDDFLDYLCRVGRHQKIHFLWRPHLHDPDDDMVLELAVESESRYLISHNLKDFSKVGRFGIQALSPAEFLRVIGEIS